MIARVWWALMAVLACLPAAAADAERSRLADERRAAEARFKAEEAQCAERFAVTQCRDDVRARQRSELAALREQEIALDEAERKRRAAERLEAIERRKADVAEPASAPAPVIRPPRLPAAPREAHAPRDGAAEAAAAARRAAASQVRASEAEADRERIRRRQEARESGRKPAAPLPVPPEAAASAPR